MHRTEWIIFSRAVSVARHGNVCISFSEFISFMIMYIEDYLSTSWFISTGRLIISNMQDFRHILLEGSHRIFSHTKSMIICHQYHNPIEPGLVAIVLHKLIEFVE